MKNHCCTDMEYYLALEDEIILYIEKFDEYGIPVHDGGSSYIEIRACPWCGKRLPQSKRDQWFNELEALGFDPLLGQDIPAEYHTSRWWENTTIKYTDLTSAYFRSAFPELDAFILECEDKQDTQPYSLFYNVLFRQICTLHENGKDGETKKYFDFLEELLLSAKDMSHSPRIGNPIQNLVQTGFLEYCWDTIDMYTLATQYMGTATRVLFDKCSTYLHVPTDNDGKHFVYE